MWRTEIESAADYGYKSVVILGSSGYVRVSVGADLAKVEYVKTSPTKPESTADSDVLGTR